MDTKFIIIIVLFLPSIMSSPYIIGGEAIDIEDAPYQSALFVFSTFICGGAIISKTFALTAAHCVHCSYCSPKMFTLQIGSNELDDESSTRLKIKEITIHPENMNFRFDIALLTLDQTDEFPNVVNFAKLPAFDDVINEGENALVTGWGLTEMNGRTSDILLGAEVPIYNKEKCRKAYEAMVNIDHTMICAGYENGGVDTCYGDSGGPIIRTRDRVLLGITSFGNGCATPGYPGIYSIVHAALDWIYIITNSTEN